MTTNNLEIVPAGVDLLDSNVFVASADVEKSRSIFFWRHVFEAGVSTTWVM